MPKSQKAQCPRLLCKNTSFGALGIFRGRGCRASLRLISLDAEGRLSEGLKAEPPAKCGPYLPEFIFGSCFYG